MSMTEPETIVRHRQFRLPNDSCDSSTDGSNADAAKAEQDCKSIQMPPIALPTGDAVHGRKGFLAPLLDALHDSRRQQASRAIHQYRHLIAAPRSLKPAASRIAGADFEPPKGSIKMTTSDDANGRPSGHSTKAMTSMKAMTWALIAACVIGFGILHIAGGAIINGAAKPRAETSPDLAAWRLTDRLSE